MLLIFKKQCVLIVMLACMADCLFSGSVFAAESRTQTIIEKAEQGDVSAQLELGWLYQYGEGVEKDIRKALEWYEKAAKQGSSQAQVNIAVIYDEGVDVPENNELAIEWYKKAAGQGHDTALLNLGVNYWKGEGVEQNYEEAWNLLNRVRMTARNKKAQWAARGALDRIKGELGAKNGEFSYPTWEKLKRK